MFYRLRGFPQVRNFQRKQIRMNHTKTEDVLVSKNHRSLVVTLNRPAALNALDLGMVHSLLSIYPESETDPNVSNIVLKGQGGKAFCAGGDIVKIYESGQQGFFLSIQLIT